MNCAATCEHRRSEQDETAELAVDDALAKRRPPSLRLGERTALAGGFSAHRFSFFG